MKSERRIGTESSKTRVKLLDAAEQLMIEEGYAAVTTRHLAAKAGLKPQLVHYYFRSMDDLLVAVLHRHTDNAISQYARALTSGKPLRVLWELHSDKTTVMLMTEFLALANHRKTIRAEIARSTLQLRSIYTEGVTRVLTEHKVDLLKYPPAAITVLLGGFARATALEESVGVSDGHAEAAELVERLLRLIDNSKK